MEISKKNLVAVAFIVVLIASYLAQRAQNEHALKIARQNVISICEKTTARDAFAANGINQVAERVAKRSSPGDQLSAAKYRAAALAIAEALPHPKGLRNHTRLIAVDTIYSPDGKVRYVLTEDAKRLQHEGCQQAVENRT